MIYILRIPIEEKDLTQFARNKFLMESYKTCYIFSLNNYFLDKFIASYKDYANDLGYINNKYSLDPTKRWEFNIPNSYA